MNSFFILFVCAEENKVIKTLDFVSEIMSYGSSERESYYLSKDVTMFLLNVSTNEAKKAIIGCLMTKHWQVRNDSTYSLDLYRVRNDSGYILVNYLWDEDGNLLNKNEPNLTAEQRIHFTILEENNDTVICFNANVTTNPNSAKENLIIIKLI